MVNCPYCGCEGESVLLKTRKFGFYEVERPRTLNVASFQPLPGVSPWGRKSEFVIRVKSGA